VRDKIVLFINVDALFYASVLFCLIKALESVAGTGAYSSWNSPRNYATPVGWKNSCNVFCEPRTNKIIVIMLQCLSACYTASAVCSTCI